eukprot:470356-Rhodomonas_salina.2
MLLDEVKREVLSAAKTEEKLTVDLLARKSAALWEDQQRSAKQNDIVRSKGANDPRVLTAKKAIERHAKNADELRGQIRMVSSLPLFCSSLPSAR